MGLEMTPEDTELMSAVDEIQATVEDNKRRKEYLEALISNLMNKVYVNNKDKYEFMGSSKIMTIKTTTKASEKASESGTYTAKKVRVEDLKAKVKARKSELLASDEHLALLENALHNAELDLSITLAELGTTEAVFKAPTFRKK